MAAPNVWTVGTGKLYATIGAAIAAAGTVSGDCIEVYATAAGFYAENVNLNKTLQVVGQIPNQGIEIRGNNAGAATFIASAGASRVSNFKVTNLGANGDGMNVLIGGTWNFLENLIVTVPRNGFTGNTFYTAENCLAYACDSGFISGAGSAAIWFRCTSVKNTQYGFRQPIASNYTRGCLAAGNGVADYSFAAGSLAPAWNVSGDLTAPNPGSVTGFNTADFVNYAGNDFHISQAARLTTKALLPGYPLSAGDLAGRKRPQDGAFYAGAYHCFPLPTWGPGEVSGIH